MSISTLPVSSVDQDENVIIENALNILVNRIRKPEHYLKSPDDTKAFLKLKLSGLEHEVFAVLFLDNRLGVIKYEEMFRGTINEASVYPREIVKEALACDAQAVILAHNHPSGYNKPSELDKAITTRIKDALKLVEIRVLDHLIIGNEITSFAERGLM